MTSLPRINILFACVENSCRSQMAEAFARMLCREGVSMYSAGSRASGRVHAGAIRAMRSVGSSMSGHRSKRLDEVPDIEYDCLVTMGCGEECPYVRAKRVEDWQIADPKDLDEAGFDAVRDEIGRKVRTLLSSLGADKP